MSAPFSQDQLESLSAQIDQELQQLQNKTAQSGVRHDDLDRQEVGERLPAQWQAIAQVIKEDPQTFWQRFKQAAHNDLCVEGGVLHTQWKKWGDLSNEAVLKSFGALLVGMGFSGNALQVLTVALAVIVMHLGCTAICDEE